MRLPADSERVFMSMLYLIPNAMCFFGRAPAAALTMGVHKMPWGLSSMGGADNRAGLVAHNSGDDCVIDSRAELVMDSRAGSAGIPPPLDRRTELCA